MRGCLAAVAILGGGSAALAQDSFQGLGFFDPSNPNRHTYTIGISSDGSTVIGYGPSAAGDEAYRRVAGTLPGLGFLDPANPHSLPTAVSAHGNTIVGSSYFNANDDSEAFLWHNGTMIGLGFLDPANAYSSANAVSADGLTVAGASAYGATGSEAFRWYGGVMTGLGFLNPADPFRFSSATGISADGSTIIGSSTFDLSAIELEAFRWNGGTMTGLGFLNPLDANRQSFATSVSADGTVVAGSSSYDATDNLEAYRWRNGTMTGLGFLNTNIADPDPYSRARAVSADGTTVVGESTFNANGTGNGQLQAFRWTEAGGMTGLGFMDPGNPNHVSRAVAVSADGSVVVGQGTFNGGQNEPFRWTSATGMRSITELLTQGGVDLTGWNLAQPTGLSASGLTVVGDGFDPAHKLQGWIARFGAEPGLITAGGFADSIGSLDAVPLSVTNRLNSVLAGEADFGGHNGCAPGAPSCAFAIGAANDGLGISGLFGTAFNVGPGLLLGLGAGYGYAYDELAEGGHADQRFPTAAAFLAHAPSTGLQFVLAASALAVHADIVRGYMNGSGTSVSSGSTEGSGYGAMARFGWAFQPMNAITLTPFAEYDVTGERLDGYTETGGPFPATIGAMNNNVQTARIGAEVRHAIRPGTFVWLSADWAHRFGDAAPAISASVVDLFDLVLPADGSDKDRFEATLGFKMPAGPHMAVNGSVTFAAFSDNTPAVQGNVGLSARF